MNLFTQTLAFGMPGWQEMLILAVIGILIFGKRLLKQRQTCNQAGKNYTKSSCHHYNLFIDEHENPALDRLEKLGIKLTKQLHRLA